MSLLSDKAEAILEQTARENCSVYLEGEWGAVNTMRTAIYKEAKRRKAQGMGSGVAVQLWVGAAHEGKPVGYHYAREHGRIGDVYTLEVLSPQRSHERTLSGLSVRVEGIPGTAPLATRSADTEAAALATAMGDIFKT